MKHPLRILSNRCEGKQDAEEAGVRFTARPSAKYEGCCVVCLYASSDILNRNEWTDADTGNQK